MKKKLTLFFALVASLLTLQASAAMYIVGGDPFGGWKTNAGVSMTANGNTYTATVDINSEVYFVFATQLCSTADDWTTFAQYRLGPQANGTVVTPGNTYTAYRNQADNSFKFTGNGRYTFTFNSSNNQFSVTTVHEGGGDAVTGDLFILGEAQGNAWDPSVGVQLSTTDGNLFTGKITFNGEHSEEDANVSYFSFTTKLSTSSDDWDGIAPYRFTPQSDGDFWVTSTTLGTPIEMNPLGTNPDAAFRIPAGTYNLTVNVNSRTTIITREGGSGPVAGKGWPAMYGGVMLQGFYWDSYKASRWTTLTDKAQELGQYFDVIWVPNSGSVDAFGTAESMGYMPVYWLKHNTCFGTETQLRDMISTFHDHNTSVIMDMVINHKSGKNGWVDLVNETATGPVTGDSYSMTWSLADICRNDECSGAGYTPTGAYDEGENFDGSRDLDHTSANVQKNVKAYQKYVLEELGYDGFRYDMCKGYAGYYVGLYNKASEPTFSVGEYWDGNAETLRWWLNETKQDDRIQTAVFDFALKYPLQSAFGGGTWSALNDKGLAGDANYQRYAVTFVDNHDTGQSSNYDCLKTNVMAANAFILTMPGTPCIFYKHYIVYADEINNCIKARRAAGVHNQSGIITQQESSGGYILETQGTRGRLYLQVGGAVFNGAPSGYTLVQGGDGYNLYISNGIDWQHVGKDGSILGYPVVNKAAGNYVGSVSVTVAPSVSGTTLVYTTDGTTPTTASTAITSSTPFTFTENTTLKVGVLNGDQVENIQTYVYTITEAASSGINIYVKSSMSNAHIWAWNDDNYYTGDNWPGMAISSLDKVTVNDIEWYCLHVDADHASVIFNNGNGGFENQTTIIPVSRDAFFVYPDNVMSSYFYTAADTYLDVTEQYAGVGSAGYEHVYVLGNINSTGWAPGNGFEMTTTNGEKYTATINFVDPYGGYSYFSFTTALGNTWDDIAGNRMGATSADFLINDARLGTNLSVVSGQNAFKIPTGKYNLTLYLSQGILVVEKWTEPVVPGDMNKDRKIDVADVTLLINAVLNGTSVDYKVADLNNDNSIDVGDVTTLIAMILSN